MPKIVDLNEAKMKAEKRKKVMARLKKLSKQPKTISELVAHIEVIEEYLGLK